MGPTTARQGTPLLAPRGSIENDERGMGRQAGAAACRASAQPWRQRGGMLGVQRKGNCSPFCSSFPLTGQYGASTRGLAPSNAIQGPQIGGRNRALPRIRCQRKGPGQDRSRSCALGRPRRRLFRAHSRCADRPFDGLMAAHGGQKGLPPQRRAARLDSRIARSSIDPPVPIHANRGPGGGHTLIARIGAARHRHQAGISAPV